MFKPQPQDAFTLIELITVIVIISILVSISVPMYNRAVERSKDNEAISNLALIAAAERVYRLETNDYYPNGPSVSNIGLINTNLRLNLNENNFDYVIESTTDTFSATAERLRPNGNFDRTWEITQGDTSANCLGPNCP